MNSMNGTSVNAANRAERKRAEGIGRKTYIKFFRWDGTSATSPIPYADTISAERAADAACFLGHAASYCLVAGVAGALAALATA